MSHPVCPLSEVTFAVIDLETTGTAPGRHRIIEVAAARFRGGECLGTFQTLVNPGCGVPPFITVLTGITEALVVPAPPIEAVLPSLLEFLGDAVLVGHNLPFDTSFVDAALARTGRPRLHQLRVDTLALARRLLGDEVPDRRLATLSALFRTATRPTHRALDDVLATAGVLHSLLERAATFGVLALDDLLALPAAPLALAKLPLTQRLPRAAGVYLFRDAGGTVLYVGRAGDIRAGARAQFSGGRRRAWAGVGPGPRLWRDMAGVEHVVCPHPLAAAVLEQRLIQTHQPRFNQRRRWRSYAYVKVAAPAGRALRLSVVHEVRKDGALYLGPLPSTRTARLVKEAIDWALPARREAAASVATIRRAVDADPALLLGPLTARMRALAVAGRSEEAALIRERILGLARALHRQRTIDGVRRAGRVVVGSGAGRVVIDQGRLLAPALGSAAVPVTPWPAPLDRREVDEVLLVARWLERHTGGGRLRRAA